VPIRSAPDNNFDTSTIILLKNSFQTQGIGKPFRHEEFLPGAIKKDNFAEKMRLISTILVTSKPLIIKLHDYKSGIALEYSILYYTAAKTNDFLHLISVLVKNQPKYFEDPDTVIIGVKTEENKIKVII
jgi:hypothetical protein